MHHLTGLEWSTGLFGLSIGILLGFICLWVTIHTTLKPSETKEPEVSEPYGDVPFVPPCNPLHVRMFERWLEADAMGDRQNRLRQEVRMLRASVEPPINREEAEARLAELKGETL